MRLHFVWWSLTRKTAASEVDVIGRDEAFEESLFLGLRLNEGVDLNHLRGQFGAAMLQRCDACIA